MRIDSYHFGEIIIDGKVYSEDIILFEDKVFSPWIRKEGHLLQKGDLEKILNQPPKILIIGAGESGLMKIPDETKSLLEKNGIEYLVFRTQKACSEFNEL